MAWSLIRELLKSGDSKVRDRHKHVEKKDPSSPVNISSGKEAYHRGGTSQYLSHLRELPLSCLEVVAGDIVVVGLHLTERFIVIPHEVVDVQILPFLDLVDIRLLSKSNAKQGASQRKSRDVTVAAPWPVFPMLSWRRHDSVFMLTPPPPTSSSLGNWLVVVMTITSP